MTCKGWYTIKNKETKEIVFIIIGHLNAFGSRVGFNLKKLENNDRMEMYVGVCAKVSNIFIFWQLAGIHSWICFFLEIKKKVLETFAHV